MYKNDKEHIFMELQLGKQKRMMYARVFDRTEEETCSADAVVPDALGDIGAIVVTEGTFCLWNLDFSDKSAQIEGSVAADVVYAEEGGESTKNRETQMRLSVAEVWIRPCGRSPARPRSCGPPFP